MRIVHLASSAELGGAERVVLDILVGLKEVETQYVFALILPAEGPLRAEAQLRGIAVQVVSWRPSIGRVGDAMTDRHGRASAVLAGLRALPASIGYCLRLRKALRDFGPSLVHAHGFKMLLFALVGVPAGVPLVLHLHDYVGPRPLMSRLLRLLRRRNAVFVAISKSVADDAIRVLGAGTRVVVVHNALDLRAFSTSGPVLDIDAIAGLPRASTMTVKIALVATMAKWKGHKVFLQALALLPAQLPVRGYVVGGAIYRTDGSQFEVPELQSFVVSLGIADKVGFTGFVLDPASAMRAVDIVVHASTRAEPFGRTIIEAMSLERAVVTSATGGAAEIVTPGENALIFRCGDAVALADCIQQLVVDSPLRRSLGTAGRQNVVRRFACRRQVDEIRSLYSDLVL